MRYPQTCIVLLRVVVGAWFLKAVWTKLTLAYAAGVIPYPAVSPRFLAFHPKRVAEFAADNPVGWYKDFLKDTVLPHATLFATLQTYGAVVVGVGLVLGLLTGLTAALGAGEAGAELRVFVTNEKSDDVTVIAAASGDVLKTLAVGKRPRGVAVSPDGRRVYVANSNSDSLSIIDPVALTVVGSVPAGR